jgi:hypothetical protein
MSTGDTSPLLGLLVYLALVAVLVGGLLVANWRAGRRHHRARHKRIEANPAAGRELVRVGYRVQRNYRRYRPSDSRFRGQSANHPAVARRKRCSQEEGPTRPAGR